MVARFGAAALALAMAVSPAASARRCAPARTAAADVSATVVAMFAALAAGNDAGFDDATTPDFFAYDSGARLTRGELGAAVHQNTAAGRHYAWTVTAPEVHESCDLAWIAYRNEGSITTTTGSEPRLWLESAVTSYAGGRWRVRFLHSTRVPTNP